MNHHRRAPSRRHRLLARITAIAAALSIGACFSACTRTDQKPVGPPEKITIACATLPETALVQIAQAQGHYREEGLEADVHLHTYGKLALREVLEGKADVATVAETPVMFAVMNGEKISVIATIHVSNMGHAILARKDRGIGAMGDLEGKRIGATLGTTSHFFLDAMLDTHGVSRKAVAIVDMKAEETPQALAHGDVDAVSVFQPYLQLAQKRLGNRVVDFRDKDIYRYTFNIVATQDFIRRNPFKVRKLLRALVKAERFAREDPAAAQKIVSDFSKIDRSIVNDFWPASDFTVNLGQALLLALEDESRWAANNGLTTTKTVPNYLDYIYFDGLTAVRPEAVRILR